MEGASDFALLLTLNLPETLPFGPADFPFPVRIVENERPKGFGANHNAAFRYGEAEGEFRYFCVLNPDIRLPGPVLDSVPCAGPWTPTPAPPWRHPWWSTPRGR